MGTVRIDPRQQFSKWLARWTAIFWFMYIVYVTTILIIQPIVADAVIYLSIIASVVMVVNVAAYTKNSTYEKFLLAAMQTNKLDLSLKPIKKIVDINKNDTSNTAISEENDGVDEENGEIESESEDG